MLTRLSPPSREEFCVSDADLQGLQAAARQLLLHVGQRQLPARAPAALVLLLALCHPPAPVHCSLHPDSQPPAERRPPLVPQLLQCPQAGHELHSGLTQVRPHVHSNIYSGFHFALGDYICASFSSSVLYFLGYSNEEMEGQSWYSLVHPEDLSSLAESHQSLGEYAHMLSLNIRGNSCTRPDDLIRCFDSSAGR